MKTLFLIAITAVFTPPRASTNGTDDGELKRHDQTIAFDVSDEIRRDARLRDMGIQLRVTGGTVTLEGDVPTFARRARAERLIEKVDGVKGIVNRIRVDRSLMFQPVPKPDPMTHESIVAVKLIPDQKAIPNESAVPEGATVRIKGIVELKVANELIVRDFNDGNVETTLEESTDVTLDGEDVEPGVLNSGLLVFIDAKRSGKELIAQSVVAFSPK
jgi:hypothetical protein